MVLLIGGLSLGAQVLLEMLTQRSHICQYAVIESASVIPSKWIKGLILPTVSQSYRLIRKKWFAKMQFHYLHIHEALFEDYYRDTAKISKNNMIAFLEANISYEMKSGLQNACSRVRIVIGEKEQPRMLRSAEQLYKGMPGSCLEIKGKLHHGEYSINYPDMYIKELLDFVQT